MNAFDGTTGGAPAGQHEYVPPAADIGFTGLDTLSMIKEAVATRVTVEEVRVAAPGGRIRLVCKPDIPERELRRWQRASLPADKRKNGNASPLDVNQMVMAALVLTHTTEYVEVLDVHDNTTWRIVEDANGEALGLGSDTLLRAFSAMDAQYLLTTMFSRESDVIRASQEVLAASGWAGENGGDEDDPR